VSSKVYIEPSITNQHHEGIIVHKQKMQVCVEFTNGQQVLCHVPPMLLQSQNPKMIRTNLLPTTKMKELLMHCERAEMPMLEDKVLTVMQGLGLRVRAVPSITKQALAWEAYNPNGILAMKYSRKYEGGFYKLQCDIIALDDLRTKKFYETWMRS